MKRFLVFVGLGPLIGFIVGMAMVQALNDGLDGSYRADIHDIVLVPLAYALGLIPALVTACFDHAVRKLHYRILWTSLFASAAAFMPLLTALFMGFIGGPYLLLFGLVGLVPGAVCSWLSSGPKG